MAKQNEEYSSHLIIFKLEIAWIGIKKVRCNSLEQQRNKPMFN